MPRIISLRNCALVLCCTLLAVPVVSGQQAWANGTQRPVAGPVHFYFCASNQIGRGQTAYISNIFAAYQQNSKSQMESEYLKFLMKRYSYPSRNTGCFDGYRTQEEARTARQTRIEQFGQIKDKVVETPWTYSAALSDNKIHPQPMRVSPPPAQGRYTAAVQTQSRASARPPAPTTPARARANTPAAAPVRSKAALSSDAELNKAEREAEAQLLKDPNLYWRVGHEPATNSDVESTDVAAGRFLFNDGGLLDVTAACFRNGIRMLFLLSNRKGKSPEFDMYTDPSASDPSDDQMVEVRIRVDGGKVHVAKGYPEERNGELFDNYMGLIFYDRGFHQRVYDSNIHNDTTFNVMIDGAIAPLVRQKAQANADDAVATAGGPLSELLSARSIRVELPVKGYAHPVIDLNPQHKVFHQYVADCNARFK